jgi:hypothetical protein
VVKKILENQGKKGHKVQYMKFHEKMFAFSSQNRSGLDAILMFSYRQVCREGFLFLPCNN